MDLTIFYVILGIVAISILILVLQKHFKFKSGEVHKYFDVMELVMDLAKPMLIEFGVNEEETDKYIDIGVDTLQYLESFADEEIGRESKIAEGVKYAKDLLLAMDIDITPNQEIIIEKMIPYLYKFYFLIEEKIDN